MSKKIRNILLALCASVLILFTGCDRMDDELLEYILNEVETKGYISDSDKLIHEITNVSDAIPNITSYDSVYENENGELYCVRIQNVQEDEEYCYVYILTDIEISEYNYEDGDPAYEVTKSKTSAKLEIELE